MARSRSRRVGSWLIGGIVVLAVLIGGGIWLYIHVIEGPAPAPLSLKQAASSAPSATASGGTGTVSASDIAGTWKVASGSQVGYRVNEVLAGQNNIAVGRTSDIAGNLTIRGTTVTAASFTVQMATIKSDQSERDAQFNGRIMQTSAYPTGTLTLTSPVRLGALPAEGAATTYHATASLTLHGHARTVIFPLQAEWTGAGIDISGSIPVVFADWGITNPSFAGFVTTQNHGLLEFLVKFGKA
jgi:polyisoprenoid-binding protein YceI